MSLEAWVAVLQAEIADGPKKAVLSGLANHAGPDGRHAYPSVVRLSVYSGLTDRTVTRVLAELVTDGLVSIVRQGGGRGHPTEYELNMKALAEMRDPRLNALDVAGTSYKERVTGSQGFEGFGSERVTATTERVTATTGKGDRESPEPYLTVLNPQDEPKDAAPWPIPNDQTPWVQILAILKRSMDRCEFDTWVQPTEVLSLSGETLTLGCGNSIGMAKLENGHRAEIEAAAGEVLRRKVRVRFVVLSKVDA